MRLNAVLADDERPYAGTRILGSAQPSGHPLVNVMFA
jgi:hypothetical protein